MSHLHYPLACANSSWHVVESCSNFSSNLSLYKSEVESESEKWKGRSMTRSPAILEFSCHLTHPCGARETSAYCDWARFGSVGLGFVLFEIVGLYGWAFRTLGGITSANPEAQVGHGLGGFIRRRQAIGAMWMLGGRINGLGRELLPVQLCLNGRWAQDGRPVSLVGVDRHQFVVILKVWKQITFKFLFTNSELQAFENSSSASSNIAGCGCSRSNPTTSSNSYQALKLNIDLLQPLRVSSFLSRQLVTAFKH